MEYITADNDSELVKHYEEALVLAKNADCDEAQYGAVIFKDGKVLGTGYNHVPEEIKGAYTCVNCPRKSFELHGGVGLELCVTVHAEEAAVDDMLITRHVPKEDSEAATIVIGKFKNGVVHVIHRMKPYCTKCSGRIFNATLIGSVVLLVEDTGSTKRFASFTRQEFHELSFVDLKENYTKTIREKGT
jgi:deoxycytidylate deaminase